MVSINTVYLISKFISFKKKNNFKAASIVDAKNKRKSS